jgi:hypothetical protein
MVFYYRLGYLPLEFHGEFAICKTLLCPGYLNTPEYEMLQKSETDQMWLKRAINNECNNSLYTYDLPLIKKMHESGMPQVKILPSSTFKF